MQDPNDNDSPPAPKVDERVTVAVCDVNPRLVVFNGEQRYQFNAGLCVMDDGTFADRLADPDGPYGEYDIQLASIPAARARELAKELADYDHLRDAGADNVLPTLEGVVEVESEPAEEPQVQNKGSKQKSDGVKGSGVPENNPKKD